MIMNLLTYFKLMGWGEVLFVLFVAILAAKSAIFLAREVFYLRSRKYVSTWIIAVHVIAIFLVCYVYVFFLQWITKF